MKLRAVLAHCWDESPAAGWYPQAQAALAGLGIATTVPPLPAPDQPVLQDWLDALSAAIGEPDEGLLLIGHSLGAIATLHWLARAEPTTRIAGVLLVAPPIAATGIAEVDRFLDPAPVLRIAALRANRIDALVSLADPWLKPDPLQLADRLRTELQASVRIVSDRGHFAPSSGQSPLPELIEWAAGFLSTPLTATDGA